MKMYLAGADANKNEYLTVKGLPRLRMLVSYWYILKSYGQVIVDQASADHIPLFLDSGAFSAMTLGAPVEIAEFLSLRRK